MIAPVPDDETQPPAGAPLPGGLSLVPHNRRAADVDEVARYESLIAAQGRVLDLLTADGDRAHVLSAIARLVETHTTARCAILLVDHDSETLRPGAVGSLPPGLTAALDGLSVGPNSGSCGTAAFRRAAVLSPDVDNDPLWLNQRDLMLSLDFKAAWSLPVLSPDGGVLATLDMFSRERRLPDEWEMRVASLAVSLTALAMQGSRSAQAAPETEAGYRHVWEASTDAVILMDEESTIQFANAALLDVFGYMPEEVVGQELAMLHPQRFVQAHRASVSRYMTAVENGPLRRMMSGIGRHKDGHEFPVEIAFSDLWIDGARRLAGFVRDTTARTRVEEALRQSEARYRALAENALDLVCELDGQGRFTYVSPNFKNVLGYEPADLLGMSAFALIHPDDQPRVGEEYARAIADPASGTITFRFQCADGSWTPLEVSANIFRNDVGEARAVIVARDIAERMMMEATLRDSEERLRTFVENAPVILFATDCEGRYTLLEGAGLARFGGTPGQFVGQSAFELYADMPVVCENMRRALAGETFVDVQEFGGATLEVHHTALRDASGAVTGMIGVISDATARLRAETALRESETRLRTFMQNAPVILFATDSQGVFTLFDGKGMEPLGIVAGQLVGQSLFESLAAFPDIVQGARQALAGETVTYVFRGQESALEVHQSPVRDQTGIVTGTIGLALHVGDRLRAEEALRKSEDHLRAVVASVPVILFATDAHGVYTLSEGAGLQGVGLVPGQHVGRSVFDVYAGLPEVIDGARRALAGEAAAYVFRLGRAALDVHQSPVRDATGEIVGTIGVAIDMSDRVRAEEALRKSEERYRAIYETHRVVRLLVDPATGLIEEANQAASDYYGYSVEEMAGMPISTISTTPPEQIQTSIREARAGDSTVLHRIHRLKSGELRDVELFAAPVEVEGRSLLYGIVQDVTERERAQEALRKSEERYRAIYETHRVVRLLVDPATGLIEEANQAASEFYGYTVQEMAGMRVSTINMMPHEQILENMRKAREEGETVFHFKHRLKSGEIRDVDLFTGPVEVDGRELLFSIIQDVTERQWAESLVTAQKQLLEMVAVDAPLADVLERVALAFEERAPGALCSVLLLSPDGTQLRHAAAPSLPPAYAEAIDGVAIGPSVGSCGTAAYLRREVIVEDIGTDPLWADFRELALSHDLRSCWSTPILSASGEVLATFAVYHREAGGVRERERSLLEIAIHVAGIAIEQDRAVKVVRSRTEELERLYRRLTDANDELEVSKQHLEEKSFLLERGLEQERERSRRDQLTGALNHAAIADVMREMIRADAGRSLAIAMVDVDGLKAANDTYGHQVGDAVLVLVAEKLARGGAIVGRYGGDEFVAIIPGADRAAAARYREGVLASLVGAGLIDETSGSRIPVVVSIGLAVYPQEAEAVDDLIRLSDSAMYESRRQRAAGGDHTHSRLLGSDRAAKMVGEIVPLLTSPGALDDKLRLVAHRLSVGAGYDGVNFLVEGLGQARQASSATNEEIDADDLAEWSRRQLRSDRRKIASLLIQTKRPIIIDDIATTDLLPHVQRAALISGGLRSTVVAPMIWQGRLIGALSVASKHLNAFTVRDVEFLDAVAMQVTAIVRMSSLVEELQRSTSQLQEAHEGTVLMLASAAEAHDHTTGRHLQRVRAISEAIARELGYDEERASALGMAATLHDIGKIRVPDSVLGSSNSLAEAEWVLMKQHTLWGAAFLSEQPGFELAASVARHHHERWDGAGYPDGLVGEDIPESALITTVADSFDAMTNHRPYRRGRPVDEAVREIQSCSGTQFSPRIVDALTRLFDRGALAYVHPDEDELAAA